MTWKQLTERDRREWKLAAIDPHDRDTWRSAVRSPMRAASQLPGRGPTVVDRAPYTCMLIKNPMMMMIMILRHCCRSMADSFRSLKIWWSMADAPPNFQYLYKLKFFQQKLKFFSNK